ncbi:Uncharacterised protein [Photobacterium damselae]|nr:hypothetical protein BST98_17765 [Photobacterium damselae]SUB90645.1 Uncharacterised protein [Photobacterium damselae]
MCNLYNILLDVYGSETAIAKAFQVERASHWKKGIPERIALLCHLSCDIPYTYNPSVYRRDGKSLHLNLKMTKKVVTNDTIKPV